MTRITTTMGDRVERIKGMLDEMVRHTGEKEDLTKDFGDVLHLIIPGDGHYLLTLGDWRHSPALESEIIGWLAGGPDGGEGNQHRRRKVLPDNGRMVHVHAKHMLDDHWKISVFNIVFHDGDEGIPEFPEGDAGRDPGMAVARIVGSGDRLPRTGAGSVRLT